MVVQNLFYQEEFERVGDGKRPVTITYGKLYHQPQPGKLMDSPLPERVTINLSNPLELQIVFDLAPEAQALIEPIQRAAARANEIAQASLRGVHIAEDRGVGVAFEVHANADGTNRVMVALKREENRGRPDELDRRYRADREGSEDFIRDPTIAEIIPYNAIQKIQGILRGPHGLGYAFRGETPRQIGI
ncbi:MAG: hypothetical protein JO089_06095 [Alphaproteobacteria bacterium]|nr:hypothetical protein [Alphaproteobacteria bacterium]